MAESAEGDTEKRKMAKQIRKAEVMKRLETPKQNFLKAIENWDRSYTNPTRQETVEKLAKTILDKSPTFNVPYYLQCTKIIYFCFTNNNPDIDLCTNEAHFIYVLKHAKLFGNQTQNMFQLFQSSKLPFHVSLNKNIDSCLDRLSRDNKYMKQIHHLISDLENRYDETKFNMLNANVTYLILLILGNYGKDVPLFRLFEEKTTSEDYIKLFKHSFDCELPRMSKHFSRMLNRFSLDAVYLAIYAFVTVKDDISKAILRKTCIQYLEWDEMVLPGLFFKVIDLYGLDVAQLWDLLSSEKTMNSLLGMETYFSSDVSSIKELIPFHHIVKSFQIFQKDTMSNLFISDLMGCLSGRRNAYLCTILAYIVDFKIGFHMSFNRNSDWVDDDARGAAKKIAKAFYQYYGQ